MSHVFLLQILLVGECCSYSRPRVRVANKFFIFFLMYILLNINSNIEDHGQIEIIVRLLCCSFVEFDDEKQSLGYFGNFGTKIRLI
jgi:hypothetical protein